MYIGPQGIVHGTYNTLLNAGRKKFHLAEGKGLAGHLFISSGLGGMSGAQPKAAEIAGAAAIIAEVDPSRIDTRYNQGWVSKRTKDLAEAFKWAEEAMAEGKALSIAYEGNIVDLLQYALDNDKKVELLSDQTSCHAVYDGGYCPQGISFEERTRLLAEDHDEFVRLVNKTLKKHFELIKALVAKGAYFFDYGNAFMRAVFDSGVKEIAKNGENTFEGFIFPVIRQKTSWDRSSSTTATARSAGAASRASRKTSSRPTRPLWSASTKTAASRTTTTWVWIRDAEKNHLVVGTQCRILYQDEEGRMKIALRFNEMVRNGGNRPRHARTRPPRRIRHRLALPRNLEHLRRQQRYGRNGHPLLRRKLRARHEPRSAAQRRRRRHRQIHQRRIRPRLDGSERVDRIILESMSWDVISGVARRAMGAQRARH